MVGLFYLMGVGSERPNRKAHWTGWEGLRSEMALWIRLSAVGVLDGVYLRLVSPPLDSLSLSTSTSAGDAFMKVGSSKGGFDVGFRL